jgi:hypothetical protein
MTNWRCGGGGGEQEEEEEKRRRDIGVILADKIRCQYC